MTLTAFSIHKKLVEEEGYDPTGDEYYNELDSRMRRDFPHKFGEKTMFLMQCGSFYEVYCCKKNNEFY